MHLSVFYVLTMALAFTNMFNGEIVPFYIKYIMAIIWIVFWLYDLGIKRLKIERISKMAIAQYCYPYLIIALWSLLIWVINPPNAFSFSNVTRMISNTVYICLTFLSAIAAVHFFGRRTIKLSLYAMLLSTIVNLLYVVNIYGINMFITYIKTVFVSAEYAYGSTMYYFSLALETQDIAMATGFYFVYYLLFDDVDSKKRKFKYLLICCICAFIGFKRTTVVGVVITLVAIWLLKSKRLNFKYVIYFVGSMFIVVSVGYIFIIKYDIFSLIINWLGVDANGRISIYNTLSKYYEFSPLYMGKGFLYVDKTMYDSIGFVAHSVIVKMFAEIGCIPFFIWIYHYLIKVPVNSFNKDGYKSGMIAFATTLYLFVTFFMENTMSLFCVQFSYLLIPLAINYSEDGLIRAVKFTWKG